jgi:hypothetical protein
MEEYRPSTEVLTACGFRPSSALNQWCHREPIHLHYFELDHAIEVYNGLHHPHLQLTSKDDVAFRAEVQALASTPAAQG